MAVLAAMQFEHVPVVCLIGLGERKKHMVILYIDTNWMQRATEVNEQDWVQISFKISLPSPA